MSVLLTNADWPVCSFGSAAGWTLSIPLAMDLLWIHIHGSELWTAFPTKIPAANTGAALSAPFFCLQGTQTLLVPRSPLSLHSALKFREFGEFS